MNTLHALLFTVALAFPLADAGADTTEAQAVQKVKDLPEYIAYARTHQHAFDDNQRITDSKSLPSFISVPAWRIDVRTVVKDSVADHLSLWNRFVLSSSGSLYVWDRVGNRYLTLDEWRKLEGKPKP